MEYVYVITKEGNLTDGFICEIYTDFENAFDRFSGYLICDSLGLSDGGEARYLPGILKSAIASRNNELENVDSPAVAPLYLSSHVELWMMPLRAQGSGIRHIR